MTYLSNKTKEINSSWCNLHHTRETKRGDYRISQGKKGIEGTWEREERKNGETWRVRDEEFEKGWRKKRFGYTPKPMRVSRNLG